MEQDLIKLAKAVAMLHARQEVLEGFIRALITESPRADYLQAGLDREIAQAEVMCRAKYDSMTDC